MPKNDSRVRENFNRKIAARDRHFAPGDMDSILPREVRPNWRGGEKQYHKDVSTYAKERGWSYGSGHAMAAHGEGKKHGEK